MTPPLAENVDGLSGLTGLLDGVPPGVQLFALVAITALVLLTRKRRPGDGRDGGAGSGRRPWVDEQASPGRFGASATRDLLPEEIRRLRPSYAPSIDGTPDPGEVVWTWVPYVENDGRGKDRPVLIIARVDDRAVAGCYLSTKDHRGFVSVGTGGWDSQGRESFLSPERVLRIDARGMRREGQVLPRDRFERAAAVVAREHGIPA